jgi:Ser/Thr protein kinase RdoA (MazF antagonist)
MPSAREIVARAGLGAQLPSLLKEVCADYALGNYISHSVISVGYEECNVVLRAAEATVVVKFFAADRPEDYCHQYVCIALAAIKQGVRHPPLRGANGHALWTHVLGRKEVRAVVMDFISGANILNSELSTAEATEVGTQAAAFAAIQVFPRPSYDAWSLVNLAREFQSKRAYLTPAFESLIAPVAREFADVGLSHLALGLVHGDIVRSNVIRSKTGEIFIVDFGVVNRYPRLVELAVVLTGLLFNPRSITKSRERSQAFVAAYTSQQKLSAIERELLPKFIRAAFAIQVLQCAHQQNALGNRSRENQKWLRLGVEGLHLPQGEAWFGPLR